VLPIRRLRPDNRFNPPSPVYGLKKAELESRYKHSITSPSKIHRNVQRTACIPCASFSIPLLVSLDSHPNSKKPQKNNSCSHAVASASLVMYGDLKG